MPTEGLEVKLTEEQYQKLYEQRRNEDVLREDGSGGSPRTGTPPEPIDDPQLQKALDYLAELLAPAAPSDQRLQTIPNLGRQKERSCHADHVRWRRQ